MGNIDNQKNKSGLYGGDSSKPCNWCQVTASCVPSSQAAARLAEVRTMQKLTLSADQRGCSQHNKKLEPSAVALLRIALHCFALHCFALHCIALHCFALHYFALRCIALPCFALHCFVLHSLLSLLCFALRCIALHCFALLRIALQLLCCALLCIALYCFALLCIALHCCVLHDISENIYDIQNTFCYQLRMLRQFL